MPRYGLLRCARNDELDISRATNQPDGQISKNLSSPPTKNIPLSPSGKSVVLIGPSRPTRGALRNVTKRAVGCGGRGGHEDEVADADGEIVWFRHPDAGVKLAGDIPPAMVARKPVARESAL